MENFRLIVEIAGGVAALIALFAPMYKSVKKQMKKVELVQDALMGLLLWCALFTGTADGTGESATGFLVRWLPGRA